MYKFGLSLALCFSVSFLASCTTKAVSNEESAKLPDLALQEVRTLPHRAEMILATWNVEHLAFPIDTGCKPRTSSEMEKLKAYALSLNADVVALQEVASAKAAALLFPPDKWKIVISPRPDSEAYTCRKSGRASTQQKLGFAVKKNLNVNRVSPVTEFALERVGLRYGLEIEVESEIGKLSILNVHLKSGCFVDNLRRSDKDACEVLSQQAPILDNWIAKKEKLGSPYAVLGDFNHRLTAPYNQLTQEITTNMQGNRRSLVNTGAHLIGCHPYYPAPIDHVFIGNIDDKGIEYQTSIHLFDDMRPDAMLSDHCAMSTILRSTQSPLSNAVKWQTKSKEYRAITQGIYQQAENQLSEMAMPNVPWVVVMDVDETVLDNSAYQVILDHSGTRFSQQTWDQWVRSKQATLVPGALEFIQKVFAMGGKVALITNRDKSLDDETWHNLSQLIPVTFDNTCLIGRSAVDKEAINGRDIKNDKDLRRQQLVNGDIDCFSTERNPPSWQVPHGIVMQIGDNIEDVEGATQHHTLLDDLRRRLNKDIFILPNPMYGSW